MKRNHSGEIMTTGGLNDTTIRHQNKPAKNLIRSKYADIKIKVDADVYHLDRIQLACKSDYFEKLFIEDFCEKNVDFLELPIMDSDTFSTIVDMIYGQELKSALNADNYVSLLMAMDYLQMKIDLKVYGKFITNFIQKKSSFDLNLYDLCNYVAENRNFDKLMPFVYTCMSTHFSEVQNHEQFLSLPLDQFAGIISSEEKKHFWNIVDHRVIDIRQCSRVCVEWIFHDVENRLSHAMVLVNAVKQRFSFPYLINIEDFKVKICDTGEEVTSDSVLRHFVEMVIYQGEIGTNNVVAPQKLEQRARERCKLNENSVDQNQQDKMTRFLENGYLHDIVVRVEGKTYKLHRCKLLSESGYFANLFSTEIIKTSGKPNKDEEFLLDVEGVDQTSFDISIKYIYHKKVKLDSDKIVGVLKTASILKIDSLMSDCELWIISKLCKIRFEIVVKILNFICNADLVAKFENAYKCLLCQRILTQWSRIDDFSSFCAISIEMLEDLLITSLLHVRFDDFSSPENFDFNDPDKLLEICSKWIMGNVQDRYHFIPRIALAINCNLTTNCNNYKMEAMPDLNNCSEQFIRDQLLKVLLSTSLTTHDTLLKNTHKKNSPVFVLSSKTMICISNAKMKKIAALQFFSGRKESVDDNFDDNTWFNYSTSATIMGNNLFIAATVSTPDDQSRIFFQVYNISSKKFTSLAYIPCNEKSFVLLNCRDDIYCCFSNGRILKYLKHFNRWTQFTAKEDDRGKRFSRFASDGKTLYKLYETRIRGEFYSCHKFFETYDFDRNLWVPVPELTIQKREISDTAQDFNVMNSGDVAVLFSETYWIHDRNSRSWRQLPLPVPVSCYDVKSSCITHYKDKLLLSVDDKLYTYQLSNSQQRWQKRKMPLSFDDDHDFDSLICVHRPTN